MPRNCILLIISSEKYTIVDIAGIVPDGIVRLDAICAVTLKQLGHLRAKQRAVYPKTPADTMQGITDAALPDPYALAGRALVRGLDGYKIRVIDTKQRHSPCIKQEPVPVDLDERSTIGCGRCNIVEHLGCKGIGHQVHY